MPSSSDYPKALAAIIDVLKRLPGIGRRTAERLALALLGSALALLIAGAGPASFDAVMQARWERHGRRWAK